MKNWIVPKLSSVIVDEKYAIDNAPINMDKVVTFERTEFTGIIDKAAVDQSGISHEGVANKAVNSNSITTNRIGLGYPSIVFMAGDEKTLFWVYDSEFERDKQYDAIMTFIGN